MNRVSGTMIISAVVSVSLIGGCATSECIDNQSALPYAGFYLSGSEDKIAVSGLSVVGVDAPNDSLLLSTDSKSESVFLPFRIDNDETSFEFRYNLGEGIDPVKEIITFRYERQPWFVSAACGAMYNFKITDITFSGLMIDTVSCPGNLITNVNKENIRIYFRESISQ